MLMVLVLTALLSLQVNAPEGDTGVMMNGSDGYWQFGQRYLRASPFNCEYVSGTKPHCRTEITIENNGSSEQVSCAFMFRERPESGRLYRWINITTQQYVNTPYQGANGTTNNFSLADVIAPGWDDITSALTLGQYNGWYYAAGTATVAGSKKYLVDYVPNVSDTSKKWEMWCWKGNLATPDNIIKLDPTWEGVTVDNTAGLVAYYDFNITNNGTELFQKVLNLTSNEGSIATSMLLVEDGWGNAGEGLLFTSINSNLSVDLRGKAFPNATTGGYTIMSCGIYNNTASVPNDMYIVQESQFGTMSTANLDEFGVLFRGSSGAAQRAAIEFVGDGQFTGTETAVPKTHYCQAFTINSGNGTEVLYFNATVTGSRADKGFDFGSGELAVGIIDYYTGDGFSQGILDWFGVWNRSLNATEISCMVGNDTIAKYGNPLQGGSCGSVAAASNAAPIVSFVNFNAANFAGNDTVRCGGIGTDADGDNLTYNLTFLVNGTLLNSSIFPSVLNGSFINVTLSNTALYNRSDRVNCTLQVNDSDAAPIWGSNQTVILNAEPSLLQVNVTTDDAYLNRTNANLTVAFGCTDSDFGDVCNSSQRIFWWNNQSVQATLENLTFVQMGNTSRADRWLAGAQVSDGWDATSLTAQVNASYNITILNTPMVLTVRLNASGVNRNFSNETLLLNYTVSDADADAISLTHTRWRNSSILVASFENTTSLHPGNTTESDNWSNEVRVFDAVDWTEWSNSSTAFIEMKNPELRSFTLNDTRVLQNESFFVNLSIFDHETIANVSLQNGSSIIYLEQEGNFWVGNATAYRLGCLYNGSETSQNCSFLYNMSDIKGNRNASVSQQIYVDDGAPRISIAAPANSTEFAEYENGLIITEVVANFTTDEPATCVYNTTGYPASQEEGTLIASNTTHHNFTQAFSLTASYSYRIWCQDLVNLTDTSLMLFSFTESGIPTQGGGGGGGGVQAIPVSVLAPTNITIPIIGLISQQLREEERAAYLASLPPLPKLIARASESIQSLEPRVKLLAFLLIALTSLTFLGIYFMNVGNMRKKRREVR